jgi:transposase
MQVERPKTASGEDRVIDLDERTVGTLLAHQLAQARPERAIPTLSPQAIPPQRSDEPASTQVKRVGRLGIEPRTRGLKVRCSAS